MVDKRELRRLTRLTREFSRKMYEKLAAKARAGWQGWDNEQLSQDMRLRLDDAMVRLLEGDMKQAVDVANLAMFLWNLGGRP